MGDIDRMKEGRKTKKESKQKGKMDLRRSDPKVFNPPLVGWIQTPIQIRFCGGLK